MGIILEIGLSLGLSLSPTKQNDQRIPYFLIEKKFNSGVYIRQYHESILDTYHTLNYKNQFETGYDSGNFRIGIGHNEELNGFMGSFQYLKISYRKEY